MNVKTVRIIGGILCGAGSIALAGASALLDTQFTSNVYHTKGTSVLTLSGEKSAGDLPVGYREVPRIAEDDDGHTGSSVNKVIRGSNVWNTGVSRKVCGTAGATVALRIADCDAQHVTKPSWDAGVAGRVSWNGLVNGNTGEGSWTLVTVFKRGDEGGMLCDDTCREVWRDDRTGFLWSDTLGLANWCTAVGASNAEGSPYGEDDPSDFCDNETYQSQTRPVSLCHEDAHWLHTPTGETDGSTYEYDNAKGNLSMASTPATQWRLPSVTDWNLAEINGVRHVLPNMSSVFWSSSVTSSFRRLAWVFEGGSIRWGNVRHLNNSVRCIGR